MLASLLRTSAARRTATAARLSVVRAASSSSPSSHGGHGHDHREDHGHGHGHAHPHEKPFLPWGILAAVGFGTVYAISTTPSEVERKEPRPQGHGAPPKVVSKVKESHGHEEAAAAAAAAEEEEEEHEAAAAAVEAHHEPAPDAVATAAPVAPKAAAAAPAASAPDAKDLLSSKQTIDDLDLAGKRVIIRVDFNVPLKDGKVVTDQRIVEALPTIKKALDSGAKSVVLISHLGRPDGQVVPALSLAPVAAHLAKVLGKPVKFVPSTVGPEAEAAVANAPENSVLLLENVRFYAEEEGKGVDANGKSVKATTEAIAAFRQNLSKLGDVYINDAFGAAHRAHSSIVGIDLPERAAGYLMNKELFYFAKTLDHPNRPVVAIVGGAKVSDKIQLLENLIDKVDVLVIGGGMAFTFKKELEGVEIGNSLYDEKGAKIVDKIVKKAKAKGVKIVLPTDYIIANKFSNDAEIGSATDIEGIPVGWMGLDIGPDSSRAVADVIKSAKTILWNGPVGVFEFDKFSAGTQSTAIALAKVSKQSDVITVIAGGDTVSAAYKFGVADKVSHVSTGGGASLELLEGKILPGIAALSNKESGAPIS